MEAAAPNDLIRVADLMAALSLATDLGMGQPLEHELGVCLAALELAERLDCSGEERSEVYFVALLMHLGCTAGASDFASWVGGDEIHFQRGARIVSPSSEPAEDMRHLFSRFADDRPLSERARLVARMLVTGQKRFEQVAANLCEGGRLLARRLYLPDEVGHALGQVTERWDGGGAGEGGRRADRPAVAHRQGRARLRRARPGQRSGIRDQGASAPSRARPRPTGRRRRPR